MSQSLNRSAELKTAPVCPHCGGAELYTKKQGLHLGLYCQACGDRWIRWLSQARPVVAMPFGKHRGTPISDLPDDYLDWLLENVEVKDSLSKALESEYERRRRTAA